jgi:hypothetical protein
MPMEAILQIRIDIGQSLPHTIQLLYILSEWLPKKKQKTYVTMLT